MKLEKHLTIGTTDYPVVEDMIELELNGFGRANLVIRSDADPDFTGLVQYKLGYSDDRLYSLFLGTVHSSQKVTDGRFNVICRELAAVLETPARLSLRHLVAEELLEEIEKLTGLSFSVPVDAEYLNKRIPYFYNLTTCRNAIECFEVWGIERGIWTQLPDGKIFWGSWDDSPFAHMDPVSLDPGVLTRRNLADRSFVIPTIPAMRPGAIIQNDLIVEGLTITGNNTRVQWLKLLPN